MRIPGAERYRARVPMGFPGPGGMVRGSPAPHPLGAGLIQVRFSCLLMTCHVPGGVRNPSLAVATGYLRSTWNPLYRVSMFADRLTMMVSPSEWWLTFGWTISDGNRVVDGRCRAPAACS